MQGNFHCHYNSALTYVHNIAAVQVNKCIRCIGVNDAAQCSSSNMKLAFVAHLLLFILLINSENQSCKSHTCLLIADSLLEIESEVGGSSN